ncbi:TetR/AcrR family transcriptional regulator [Flaviflexus sp.]|uniref:TetR/AcrR family transcriptional regulator n=1 Tax=Flaviflexus sp. TaxID=1969482 RepID=UPI003F9164EC
MARDAQPRQVGRPARISRDNIIDTVLEIGIDRATIAAVAERLTVDPSTLYGHIKNRDDMLGEAADRAIRQARWPQEAMTDWRTFLEAIADRLWELYCNNSGLAQHLRSMPIAPPALLSRSAQIVTTLVELFDIPLGEAALAVDSIGDSVIDSFIFVSQLDSKTNPDGPTMRAGALASLHEAMEAGVDEQLADYITVLEEALGQDGVPGDYWKDKIALILDGLTYRLEKL